MAAAVGIKTDSPQQGSSAPHKDPDSEINKLTVQIFGKCIYQRTAFASDACELSVDYSYSIRYADFKRDQEKTKEFLRQAQEKCEVNVRILGPTLEDFLKEKEIELNDLSVRNVYQTLDKTKTIGNEIISDLDSYLDAKINSELNKHLPGDYPHLFFMWDGGSYRLEDDNRKSFDKIMNGDLFKKLAECVGKASQVLKRFFDKNNEEFCKKLESMGIRDKDGSELKEKASQSFADDFCQAHVVAPLPQAPPQVDKIAVSKARTAGKRPLAEYQYGQFAPPAAAAAASSSSHGSEFGTPPVAPPAAAASASSDISASPSSPSSRPSAAAELAIEAHYSSGAYIHSLGAASHRHVSDHAVVQGPSKVIKKAAAKGSGKKR